jgi:hypothetical protein
MNSQRNSFNRIPRPLLIAALFAFALPALAGSKPDKNAFGSPQEAVDALVSAVKSGSAENIVAVLGPEGRELASSGDAVADAEARERFTTAYDEAHELKQEAETRHILIIGKDDFPFPIPIVEEKGAYRFDTEAGAEEILDRRIGENELAAIKAAQAYVDAQREYADADRDGKGPQYARKFLSTEGKQDGLYWPTAEDEAESPLGPLVANARAEGYRKKKSDAPEPYHGYLFRILTAQGKDAPGGAQDYLVKDRMIGGFGLVATPARYGNSGVKTFIVNQDGIVYEKDIGPESMLIGGTMRVYNPDSTWSQVKQE